MTIGVTITEKGVFVLKLELESLDGIDDSLKGFYSEADGKYRLNVDGVEDTGALKRAKEHEKEARKAAEAKARELADQIAALQKAQEQNRDEGHRKAGDVEALDKSWQEKLARREKELADQLTQRDGYINKLLVDSVAMRMASDLAVEGASEVLLPHIKGRLAVEMRDGEPVTVVKDRDGNLSALSLEELQQEFANSSAFAAVIRGSKASGAGSAGKGGGAAPVGVKKPTEMTPAEKADFITKNGLDAWTKLVTSSK